MQPVQSIEELVQRALSSSPWEREEMLWFLREDEGNELLRAAADRVREKIFGPVVHLRAIIEFSNFCRNNCLYCGLRRDNRRLARYRMSEAELLEAAAAAVAQGFKTIVLQSGEDPLWPPQRLAPVVQEIKSLGVAVTLSVGELTYEDYALLRRAGADRYLLRHETSDPELFARLKPDSSLARRLQCLAWLKDLGYETGAGCMVGLPGQSMESIAEDILLMKELEVEMAGIGPFISHPDTPLGQEPPGSPLLALKVVALARLHLPYSNLPATTAAGVAQERGREAALTWGANVVMPDVTPHRYRLLYQLYPGKAEVDATANAFDHWQQRLLELGREVGKDLGFSARSSSASAAVGPDQSA
ncbi:[FeFe] hydrogenase H-cluster radical SAM maturase HydE [Desulfothermobacter acidiphilus]|uniref:[FeFe] hydrogenase H-cluster radical SAM maturase HydE n=1 Tax=Desulfothermobacter acidiphilus TaxID=1938353 RepID=UPI003F8AF672